MVRMLAPPLNFLYVAIQQSGSSKPLSRLKRSLSGFVRMFSDSFMTSSMVRLARCRTFVASQRMGWSFVHACSAIADLSVRPFLHASRCSFSLVPSLRLVSPMYTWPQVQGTSYTTFACFSMGRGSFTSVSYTHLTLPTIYSV